jgi:hypothetical protein
LFGFLIGLEFDSKHPGYSRVADLLPEALQDLMTARNLNLFLLAVRMTSAGAAKKTGNFGRDWDGSQSESCQKSWCRQDIAAITQSRARDLGNTW